jgi:hypothetical protein
MGLFFKKKKSEFGEISGSGVSYSGEKDQDGKPHGIGTMKYSNGDRYEGRWEHGHRVGGTLYIKGGYRYEGAFDDEEYFTGHGKYYYPEGDVFEGEFVKGNKNGFGRYVWDTGTWSEGNYVNDVREGPTKMYRADDKCIYEGTMVNDRFMGYLKIFAEDGNLIYEGETVNGKCVGKGRLYVHGGYIDGVWNDLNNCEGLYYAPDGSVSEILLRNGKFIKGGNW